MSRLRRKLTVLVISLLAVSIVVYLSFYLVNRSKKAKYYSGPLLVGQEIMKDEPFGFPTEIVCVGQRIAILDCALVKGSGKMRVYDCSDLSYEGSTARTGAGVGEVRDPTGLNAAGRNEVEFSISHLSLEHFTVYRLDRYGQIKAERIVTPKGGMPYGSVMVNDTMILNLAFGITSNRVAVYDSAGNLVKRVGVLLPGKNRKTPVHIHNQASQGTIRLKPHGSRFVVNALCSDIIEIYNLDGTLVKRFHGPLNVSPRYDVVSVNKIPVMAPDERCAQFGYVHLAVSDERIYALYCGRPFAQHNVHSRYVHVYNWDGDFLKTYMLDPPVGKFAIDTRGERFFGIALEPRVRMLMFKIKD
ncbi:MAG: BF3164 family lipoprotein [Bacteroidota bacterium]